jgi:uncharacterized protein
VRLVAQEGADLRIRLDRVLTDLLAESGSGAIAIDTDSPTLPTDYVRQAYARLAEATADVVIGPSEDGGYYLIGLRRPAPALFEAMPWSTAAVLDETVARTRRLGFRLALLPPWFDVDRGESAAMLGAYRAARSLAFLDRELAY